ncbi:MAG: WD40 repeat domain-containing protein, partial [Fimbriiglobus sp.]
SPDGTRLATCGGDGSVRLWTVPQSGSPVPQRKLEPAVRDPDGAPVVALAFSADGRFLAAGGKDSLVRLWDVRTGSEVRALRGHTDWVTAAAFRPDGQSVVSVGVDKTARVWDLARRDAGGPAGHALQVRCLAVSRDGKRFATGSEDRTVKVWELATGKEIATLAGPTDAVNAVAFDESGRVLACSADGTVRAWTGPAWTDEIVARTGPGFGLAVSADGTRVAVAWAKREEKLAVFEVLKNGAEPANVTQKGHSISCAVIAPDGALGVTGGEDGVARVWDLDKNDRVGGDWPLFDKTVADLGVTPDNKTLIAIDVAGTVKVADIAGREVTATIPAAPDGVNGLVVAPTGDRFATLSAEGEVKAWDLKGKELRAWKLPTPAIAAAFTADGKRLVTGNKDGSAYVLELP